ncbi:hypothetical protein RB195_006366 [Necator americanus]|uniref:Uncharacterized protein n=1 Tax=Necator americanus TaxID=51031 RepID=A0ABR1BW32_NECAM
MTEVLDMVLLVPTTSAMKMSAIEFTLQLHRVSSVAHYPGGRQIKFIHVRNVCRNTSGQPALYTIGKLVWKRNMKSLLKKEWPRRGLDIFQFGFQMCPQG